MKNQIKKINISGSLMKKIIIGTVIGVMIIASCMMTYQHKKISQLEEQVYLKQQVEDRATDYTVSILNSKTIEEKFNEVQMYPVLKNSTIRQTHTYEYDEEAFLGLHKKAVLSGAGNLVYDVDICLSSATIDCNVETNTITILLDEPTLDLESVHLEQDSLVIKENDYNFLCGTKDGEKVMSHYRESFVDKGKDNLEEYYSNENSKNRLRQQAIREVKSLVQTLNLKDCNVIVKMK